jgi:hypothetical protein
MRRFIVIRLIMVIVAVSVGWFIVGPINAGCPIFSPPNC